VENKSEGEEGISIDIRSLSHANLVEIIQELKGSKYPELLQKAQKELVERLKKKGFNNQKIVTLLTTNVYGVTKKKTIAKEWADALGITKEEFIRLIGIIGKIL
jgi:broad-specificity NMP kinase